MQRFFITLAAAASYVAAQTPSASPIGAVIPVGQQCTPGGTPCALGASCYATNSGLQTVCGNFQAQCTSDQQCAFNLCNQGFCNGVLASPSASVMTPTATTVPTSLPTAPAGTLPLGAQCDPSKSPSQCAGGAQCWASNSMLIAACGNFNAACTSDAQCAFNTCNNGLCNGGLKPSGGSNTPSTVVPTSGPGVTGTQTASGPGPTSTQTTGSVPPVYTGAASLSRTSELGGVVALLIAAIVGNM